MRANETWSAILHWKKSSQFGELQKENLEIGIYFDGQYIVK